MSSQGEQHGEELESNAYSSDGFKKSCAVVETFAPESIAAVVNENVLADDTMRIEDDAADEMHRSSCRGHDVLQASCALDGSLVAEAVVAPVRLTASIASHTELDAGESQERTRGTNGLQPLDAKDEATVTEATWERSENTSKHIEMSALLASSALGNNERQERDEEVEPRVEQTLVATLAPESDVAVVSENGLADDAGHSHRRWQPLVKSVGAQSDQNHLPESALGAQSDQRHLPEPALGDTDDDGSRPSDDEDERPVASTDPNERCAFGAEASGMELDSSKSRADDKCALAVELAGIAGNTDEMHQESYPNLRAIMSGCRDQESADDDDDDQLLQASNLRGCNVRNAFAVDNLGGDSGGSDKLPSDAEEDSLLKRFVATTTDQVGGDVVDEIRNEAEQQWKRKLDLARATHEEALRRSQCDREAAEEQRLAVEALALQEAERARERIMHQTERELDEAVRRADAVRASAERSLVVANGEATEKLRQQLAEMRQRELEAISTQLDASILKAKQEFEATESARRTAEMAATVVEAVASLETSSGQLRSSATEVPTLRIERVGDCVEAELSDGSEDEDIGKSFELRPAGTASLEMPSAEQPQGHARMASEASDDSGGEDRRTDMSAEFSDTGSIHVTPSKKKSHGPAVNSVALGVELAASAAPDGSDSDSDSDKSTSPMLVVDESAILQPALVCSEGAATDHQSPGARPSIGHEGDECEVEHPQVIASEDSDSDNMPVEALWRVASSRPVAECTAGKRLMPAHEDKSMCSPRSQRNPPLKRLRRQRDSDNSVASSIERLPTPSRHEWRSEDQRLSQVPSESDSDEIDGLLHTEEAVAQPEKMHDDTAHASKDQAEHGKAATCGSREPATWRTSDEDASAVELVGTAHAGSCSYTLPRATYEKLYGYQREGVAWMADLWRRGHGGILADEMGLGKTVQICAFLNGARKAGATHALLLVPTSLLDQWSREARKWCPGWPVRTYHGSASERARAIRHIRRPAGGILLTTYTILGNVDNLFDVSVSDAPSPPKRGRACAKKKATKRQKLQMYDDEADQVAESEEEEPEPEVPRSGLPAADGEKRPWDVVICDEAHRMKNISTLLGKSLRKVRASCRLLLSGTPVQNALQDLWALMDFAQPGILGNHATFVRNFSDPINSGSVRGANPFHMQLKMHLTEQLQNLIEPHLLRRTKASVGLIANEISQSSNLKAEDAEDDPVEVEGDSVAALLPPKRETIVWLSPTEHQFALYQKSLEKSEIVREACSKAKMGVEAFRAIGVLKQLCNHPSLLLRLDKNAWKEMLVNADDAGAESIQEDFEDSKEAEDVAVDDAPHGVGCIDDDDIPVDPSVEEILKDLPTETIAALRSQSAKLKCLNELLPALAARGHRTLVFSQSVKMLELVQLCCLKPNGLRCLRMDGQTGRLARAEKLRKFNEQRDRFHCMLLTTGVGGVGLNLTSADRVVLVDPAWNPATDAQAVDRAFRIGQEKQVKVYRLIMSGFIEDKMFRLQIFKMGLMRAALEVDQQQNYFTGKEIRALFEWTDPAKGETRGLLAEKHGGELDDEAVKRSAYEDGAAETWLQGGHALCLTDFGIVHSKLALLDESPKDECSAQLSEAKQKLKASEDKVQQSTQQRQEAEARRDAAVAELSQVTSAVEALRDQRLAAEDALKKRRGDVAATRRAELASQRQLERYSQMQSNAKVEVPVADQTLAQLTESVGAYAKGANDTRKACEDLVTTCLGPFADADIQLAMVDSSGCAVDDGVVNVDADRVNNVSVALTTARQKVVALNGAISEVQEAASAMMTADADVGEAEAAATSAGQSAVQHESVRAAEQSRKESEQALLDAQERLEVARLTASDALQTAVQAGMGFADAFEKTQRRSVGKDQVKAAQKKAKASFRQLSSAWQPLKKGFDGWAKALGSHRKAVQKVCSAAVTLAGADKWLADCERDHSEAKAEEERCSKARADSEAAVDSAKAALDAVEAEDVRQRRRRDELKSSITKAKQEVKSVQSLEKEARQARRTENNEYVKVEQAHLDMEDAKSSAIKNLQEEKYDADQVNQAYELKRKFGA